MDHTCSKCEKKFSSEELLQRHLLINTCKKIVQYTCEPCSYTTKIKCNYNKHLNTQKCIKKCKEVETQDSKYKCQQCHKIFRDGYNLEKHINRKYSCIKYSNSSIINNMNNNITNTNSNNIITNTIHCTPFTIICNTLWHGCFACISKLSIFFKLNPRHK